MDTDYEDRRPSSNADPYLVTGKIMATIMEDVEMPDVKATVPWLDL